MVWRWLPVVLLLAACGGHKDAPPQRFDGGPPPRRVIEPPARDVRALPPHAITAAGIGPYKLRTPLSEILKSLPSGPRMALLQIPGIVDYAAARDEGLLIGGERQGDVSFIAVLREGFARTAEGVGVGAPEAAMVRALGPAVDDPRVVRDPALWNGAGLPGARFVLDNGKVLGVVLAVPPELVSPPAAPVADGDAGVAAVGCVRAPVDADDFAGLVPSGLRYQPACLGAADGFAASGDVIVVATRATGEVKAKRVAAVDVRGLRWVAPIRADDGRDELVAVAEDVRDGARIHAVVVLRLEGTRLVRIAEADVYRLDDQSAAWIGAAFADLALRLEVINDGGDLRVGGVLVHASGGHAHTLAPLQPVTMRRRRTTDPESERDRTKIDPDGGVGGATADSAPADDAAVDAHAGE